jgi:Integrase core domain
VHFHLLHCTSAACSVACSVERYRVQKRARPRAGIPSSHSPLRSARTPAQRQWARIYRLLHAGLAEGPGDQDVHTIKPGSPWENGHIESFHDKLREECLNRELFGSRHEARVILESWRVEYSERRPHSSLGYQSPNEYACRRMNSLQPFVRCHVVLPQYSADLCQFLERRDRRTMDTLVQRYPSAARRAQLHPRRCSDKGVGGLGCENRDK